MRIDVLPYDHPDAVALIAELQHEYVVRYGEQDHTPVDAAEFAPPVGLFLVGYDGDAPVVCGGWRVHEDDTGAVVDGAVELKRMYVSPAARGRGFARAMIAELERTAHLAGHREIVLMTGQAQPEAIALYTSSGYADVPRFGFYADEPDAEVPKFGYYAEAEESGHLGKSISTEVPACPSTR